MQLTHDITNRCFYWLIEKDDADIVVSPEFKSEETAYEWLDIIAREVLKTQGIHYED